MASDTSVMAIAASDESGESTGPLANAIDVHVGSRLRERRRARGMSQGELGSTVSLTYQQIQKYEQGTNRISASRLFDFAGVLEVSVDWFFEGLSGSYAELAAEDRPEADPEIEGFTSKALRAPETGELVTSYYEIEDAFLRRRLLELVKAIGRSY